ncbi:MAG: NHLP family bacteriocin export ABC transporter peptidase/permease/ATPase subunit [Bacteroidales bacterium]
MSRIKRVPMIMQLEIAECGAASLGMILAYYGKWLPLEKLRKDCGVSRDGSNAKSLLQAAREYGLEAQGMRIEPGELATIAPAIIHWEFNHFLVFKGFKRKLAYLNDPAKGPIVVSLEEFDRSFTGIALAFKKGPNFVAEGHAPAIGTFIHSRLAGAKEAFAFALIFGVLTAFIGLIFPFFSQVFIDSILTGKDPNIITPFLLIIGGAVLFSFIVNAVKSIYSDKYEATIAIKANSNFLLHALHLPMDFFAQRYAGDLIFRQGLNQSITSTLVSRLGPLLVNIILLVLYLFFMLSYNVFLTGVGIAVIFINIFLVHYISKKQINIGRTVEIANSKYYGVTMSCLDNIETVKAVGGERGFFEYWAGCFTALNNAMVKSSLYSAKMNIIPQIFLQLTNILVLILGARLILSGEFTIGMLLAFQGFMGSFLQPIQSLQSAGTTIVTMRSQMERVEDVFQYPLNISKQAIRPRESGKLGGHLEMKNVTFGYNERAAPLIENFSLDLPEGKSVAFVGTSGCGKSTLAKLISGLYKPWKGEILFNGYSLDEISHSEFVNSVAVIDQNVVLFDDTISANIKMWDASIEDFSMILACNDAQIREDIIARPNGFNAKLMHDGQNFSGGQRQRIEIATALAREPTILIMDEATSALDVNTENNVMKAIKSSRITLVIVAHRLSTIRDCDEIIVMDKGKIAERGTHESLMAYQGVYYELMKSN